MNKSDRQLQQDVMAELAWDPALTATHIGVQGMEGVITLTGHVATFAEKWAAERAALRVTGVRALAVELNVDLAQSDQRSDADISAAVCNVLQLALPEFSQHIKVMVEQGWLTLGGEVEWHFQRKSALKMVSHVMRVKGVSNNINIRPKLEASTIREEVRTALKRRAISDIDTIAINIDGPDITLSGTVHSWSERALAQHAATCMPGVREVVNKIRVTI